MSIGFTYKRSETWKSVVLDHPSQKILQVVYKRLTVTDLTVFLDSFLTARLILTGSPW